MIKHHLIKGAVIMKQPAEKDEKIKGGIRKRDRRYQPQYRAAFGCSPGGFQL